MAHNPILNAYLIELNAIGKQLNTFGEFCRLKFYSEHETPTNTDLFKTLFENIVTGMGGASFRKDTQAKKVIGVPDKTKGKDSLSFFSTRSIIEGIVEGGKYGILREYADINNKEDRETLDGNKAVLDVYYLYLYAPLNSSKGVLLIQSYTEETIQQPLKDFFQDFFSLEDHFYKLKIDNYVPERVVENFANDAAVRLFQYKTIIGIGNSLRGKTDTQLEGFEVTIQLKPIGKLRPTKDIINDVMEEIEEKEFDNVKLEKTKTKQVFIEDSNKRKANYDIAKQIASIKPTIYLLDEGVSIIEKTGLPDFTQVEAVCKRIANEILEEINRNLKSMNFKKNLYDLIRMAHEFQYKEIGANPIENELRKPRFFFTKWQFAIILLSLILSYFSFGGLSNEFSGYVISALSLLVGMFFTFLITLYDKFRSIDFSRYARSVSEENAKIGQRLKNYFKKITVLTLYETLISILCICLLAVNLLADYFSFNVKNTVLALSVAGIDWIITIKVIMVFVYKTITFYFLLDFLLIAIYIISSFYDFMISEYNEVKI